MRFAGGDEVSKLEVTLSDGTRANSDTLERLTAQIRARLIPRATPGELTAALDDLQEALRIAD